MKFFEVIGVDEIAQTVTLSINANLYWNDYRLDVNRSEEYIKRYVDLSQDGNYLQCNFNFVGGISCFIFWDMKDD